MFLWISALNRRKKNEAYKEMKIAKTKKGLQLNEWPIMKRNG